MKKFYFLFSLLPLLSCCDNEVLENADNNLVVAFVVNDFECIDESDVESRTNIKINNSSDRRQYSATFSWSLDDTLGVIPQYGEQTAFPLSQVAGGTLGNRAFFDGCDWRLRGGAKYVAYYPFCKDVYFKDSKSIEVVYTGQKQISESSTHVVDYDYLVSDGGLTEITEYTKNEVLNSGVGFQMQHVGSLIRFTFVIPYSYAGSKVFSKLTVSTDGTPFVTKGYIDLVKTTTPTITPTETSASFSIAAENLKPNIPREVHVYAMIPPNNYTGTWTITLEDSDGVHGLYGTKTAKLKESGKCYGLWFDEGTATLY